MKHLTALLAAAWLIAGPAAAAETYRIDTEDAHAFIQFRISHLGYSWLYGRFNDFTGEFTFDPEAPENSRVQVEVQTASVDTNLQRRDEHLRDDDFLTVDEFPTATFTSTAFEPLGEDRYRMTGDLELLGRTREIVVDVEQVGAGEDPWGGFRRGFEGTTALTLADFGIDYDLGEEAETMEMTLSVEGIRQDG